MLHLTTGTPGAKKTVFTVSKLDKIESDNKVNILKNQKIYIKNLDLIEKYKSDFEYIIYEVGSGHTLRNEIEVLSDDYFSMFTDEFDDLRPDDYYQRVTRFNDICERIAERDGEESFKRLLPVRTIYTNINGLKIDFVRSLNDLIDDRGFVDWRKAPDGSVIVIDEVQLVAPFDEIKSRNEPIVQDLTIHRHRGFDFYFITQYPSLLHPTVKDLIGLHWHLTVPYGVKTKVYQFGSTRAYPNTMANKSNCETTFYFTPAPRLFKLYKSTTIDTHKKRIPYKQLAVFGILILAAFAILVYGISGGKNSGLVGGDSTTEITAVADTDKETEATPVNSAPVQTVNESKIDNLKQEYLPDHIYLASLDDDIRPASVMMMGDKCLSMNKYGERLNIDDSLCRLMISDSTMMPKARTKNESYNYSNNGQSVDNSAKVKVLPVEPI